MPRPARMTLPDQLAIIHTGGTFGCAGTPLTPLPAQDFLPILQHAIAQCWQRPYQLTALSPLLDSSQIQPQDWHHLAQLILQYHHAGIRQVLIIHGTDTLAYTAAWLAECFAGSDLHVVLTGSQSPLLDPKTQQLNPASDAQENLHTAIAALCRDAYGVFVSFAGETWPAQTVQKIHSLDVAAFSGHPRAGYPASSYQALSAHARQLWQQRVMAQLHIWQQTNTNVRVVVYYATPMPHTQLAAQLRACCSPTPDALILMGYGAGNFPEHPEIRQVLQSLTTAGVLVVASTSVPFGGTNQVYATGHWLSEIGVLPTARLTLPAIYVRLLWICALQSAPTARAKLWLTRLDEATSP